MIPCDCCDSTGVGWDCWGEDRILCPACDGLGVVDPGPRDPGGDYRMLDEITASK